MNHLLKPARTLPDVLYSYVAAELVDDLSAGKIVTGGGMPSDTVCLESANAILSITCGAAPMFRAKIERIAAAQSIDVLLVRCCMTAGDLLPIAADVVLAGGGLAPFVVNELALYRHGDGGLWLVPHGFGGAIRFEAHGFELYLVPPYATLTERPEGIYRTASELAALLYPQEAN